MSGKNVLITAVIALGVVLGVQYYQARKAG
jgi:predicted negative regulator of RcsB-dependent stress response